MTEETNKDGTDVNIFREIDYIVGRATMRVAHFIALTDLVLFSTETGDAWMLDPKDGTALCLAVGGERQGFRITDTTDQFRVEWNADYRIDGDRFVVAERAGRVRSIAGYPISHIQDAIRSMDGVGVTNPFARSPLIGYSAFDPEEEDYELDDAAACFVADTPESLQAFLERSDLPAGRHRTDEVRLSDILADYGDSDGCFCMEPGAKARFETAAIAADVEFTMEELDEDLFNVEVALPEADGVVEIPGIRDIPAAEPLLAHLDDETPPEAEIAKLAEAIRADPALAGPCLALFDAEVKLRREAHGALLVWLGFALALAGDGKSRERFGEIVRLYGQDDDGEILPGHYRTALDGLALYEEVVREAAGRLPFSDAELEKPFAMWRDLQLLTAVGRSGDELLRKKVAVEAERLLKHPALPDEYVEPACKALAAADPKRALDVVPSYLKRCEDPRELKRIVRAIRKSGSAVDLLAPPWPVLAGDAADDLLDDLEAEDFDGDDEGDEDEDGTAAHARIDELVAGFVASFGGGEAGARPSFESATSLTHAFHVMWNYRGTLPEDASPADIEELMVELVPRKAVDDETGFRTLGFLLAGFYRYMADKGFVENGEDLVRTVERCTEPMVRNAADPAHWGVGKGLFSETQRDGVGPTDQAAMDRWMRDFNARPLAERARLIPGPGSLPMPPDVPGGDEEDFEAPPPPEPDPYAPCPCGSGKKYKWCCREKDRKARG